MKAKQLFTTSNKEVLFVWIDPDFTTWFGDMEVEKRGQPLTGTKLPRIMTAEEIRKELNPTDVSLGEIYEALKGLDRDTYSLFFVKDAFGAARTVGVHWYGGGWRVGAYPVSDPLEWGVDDQVFSRDSRDTKNLKPV